MKKILLVIALSMCITLCSCTHDFVAEDFEFTDTQKLEYDSIPIMEYTSFVYERCMTESFFEEYPCSDAYYGYNREENLYLTYIDILNFSVPSPLIGLDVDERRLLCFTYDDETYLKAKAYLMENMGLSEHPIEEYNEYVFYDIFDYIGLEGTNHDFSNFVYNDDTNTIIILELYYNVHNKDIYNSDYQWHEYIQELYSGWYNFS